MLDFYFMNDSAMNSKSLLPENLEFAGSLDDKAFQNLKAKGIIESRYDYYSDFRWNVVQVKQIHSMIHQKSLMTDSDVKTLKAFLDQAMIKECGLIAYCD